MTAHRIGLAVSMLLLIVGCGPDRPTDPLAQLTTRAERTRYEQTTGYGEVVRLMEHAATLSERVHFTTFGTTVETRPLPLVVVGDTTDARPESVVAAGRTRVWLQGAIHGGEVCGKEALLMLLRDLVAGEHQDWSSSLTLLIAPIYNADGAERIGPDTRPYQLGPLAGVGERANTQGLDLNRDHMKLESPEARAISLAYQTYDPHVIVDLHTTNGTEHGYHLTYSPPLHPNTHPELVALLREEWLPTVTQTIKTTDGWDFYYYGNLPFREGGERAWRTFDHRARFNNNYAGLRNRIGILSEAYAYVSFQARVAATLRFVEEVLHFAHDRADQIARLVQRADQTSVTGTTLVTRGRPARSAEPVEILLGQTEEVLNPYTRAPMRRRLDVVDPERMFEYGTFEASVGGTETAPDAYYIPGHLTAVIDLLAAHGVDGVTLDADTTLQAEEFIITESVVLDRPIEGHRERRLEGRWTASQHTVPAGTVVAPVSQPLGRLVFALLEPRSDDGVVNWNLLDDTVAAGTTYPILRVPSPPTS